jgi:hypothetical protein
MQLFIRHKYIKISPAHRQKDFHAQYLKRIFQSTNISKL